MDTNQEIILPNEALYRKAMTDLSGLIFGRVDKTTNKFVIKLAINKYAKLVKAWLNQNIK